MKRSFQNGLLFCFVLAFTSCSLTKFVPENKYLLSEVHVVSDNKEVKAAILKGYIRQQPNAKWFSLLKIPLYTYNLSGRDSTKWSNRFLRRIGDAPVLYDAEQANRSSEELVKALNNMGYMGASVHRKEQSSKKKMVLTYVLHPGKPYVVNGIRYDIPDLTIASMLKKDTIATKLKQGMLFDANVLNDERQRITDYLLRQGYYKFNKDYVTYTADTVRGSDRIDLTLHILPYKAFPTDSNRNHNQYKVRRVSFLTEYDVLKSAGLSNIEVSDSINYGGMSIYFKDKLYLRPKTLMENTRIIPGSLYNDRAVQNTYNSFGRLRALKYTNIRFFETQVGDSSMLDCYVLLTKSKHKSVSFELEGTNSAGDLGAAASVSFQHRNLFRGSETFTFKVRGAYEAISGLKGYSSDNYTEYGAETSLNFPNFVAPFLSSDFKRRVRATSEVGLQYNSQLRPEFARTIASASWSYKWTRRQRTQHRFDLMDVNYVYMPWISKEFEDKYLTGSATSILKYNYQNLLIVRSGYTFNYNSAGTTLMNNATTGDSYSIRANFESAGNLLYVLSKAVKMQQTDGAYSILGIAYAQYVKGDFDYAKNIEIDKRNSLAFHVGLGIAYPYGNTTDGDLPMLPFEKRYFSGGANSVRGWSVRELGPGSFTGDGNFMNQSGDLKLDLSIEYRTHLFWKIQGAAFIDGGNIWTLRNYASQPGGMFKFSKFYKEIAVAYGLGLRLDFNFFVLRFDGGMKAINPAFKATREHYPIFYPDFKRDFAFHFAVGYPF